MERSTLSRIFMITLLCALFLLLTLFWAYFTSILLALILASTFHPFYVRVCKFLGGRERLSAFLVVALILLVLIIPAASLLGSLSGEALELYGKASNSVSLKKIQEAIHGNSAFAVHLRKAEKIFGIKINGESLQRATTSLASSVGFYLSRQISAAGSNLLSFLVHFFLMVLMIYYLFRDGPRLKGYISELLPFPSEQQELLMTRFRSTVKAILFGNGINCVVQGILGGFGFLIFNLGSPVLWGTFIAFSALLPVVGSSIVFVPATAVLALQGKHGTALAFLVYSVCYSLVMENVIKPRLIGKEMRMNSLLVFIGILGGLKTFGILGIIYGPLIMAIFFTLADIYRLEYRDTLA
jgi:predicted PurR-regulated permease PerM